MGIIKYKNCGCEKSDINGVNANSTGIILYSATSVQARNCVT
jgi:hypothetical protein